MPSRRGRRVDASLNMMVVRMAMGEESRRGPSFLPPHPPDRRLPASGLFPWPCLGLPFFEAGVGGKVTGLARAG